jgi:hypothetical protein
VADYAARTQDGYLQKQGTTYAGAQAATPTVDTAAGSAYLGQQRLASNDWYIWRAYLSFDTTAIPAGSTVLTAKLNFYVSNDATDTDFNIVGYYNTQPTWGGTLAAADWGSGVTSFALRSTAGIATDTLYSLDIPLASVNPGGITEYELRSSREGTTAVAYENVAIATSGNAAYKPSLTVTYELPSDGDSMDQDGACVVLITV